MEKIGKEMIKLKLVKTLAFLIFFSGFNPPAIAAGSKAISYKGIGLTPAIETLDLSRGQSGTSYKIQVTNQQSQAVQLHLSSLDFKSLNDTGGIAFVGNGVGSSHGLANWISFPQQDINLNPGQGKLVQVNIDNRDDLTPGGHYAAILFSTQSATTAKGNKVALNQVVSSLVFIRKHGGENYSLAIDNPGIKWAWWGIPTNFNLIIKNNGNTQTAPRGIITISAHNKVYGRGILNQSSALVLPDSERLYPTSVTPTGHAWIPGVYKLTISVRPDVMDQAQTADFNLFYINLLSIVLILIIALSIVLILRRSWRRKIKRVLSKKRPSKNSR